MSVFIYQAVGANGDKVAGELEAQNRIDAYRKLDKENLQPVSLELKDLVESQNPPDKSEPLSSGLLTLSRAQIILFTEELSDMLDAGLQLEPALGIMEQRQELSSLKSVTAALRQRVREGRSFSSSLRSVSNHFGELYCNLVAAGEMSGALPQILRRQVGYLTTMDELQARVLQAMIYPAFITGAGVLLLFVFMTVLVPQLTVLFIKTGKELPMATRMLIGVSGFMAHYWWGLLAGGIALGLSFWQAIRQPAGRLWWDEARLKIPFFGPILTARFYAQLAQTLATLVGNGIPLLNGLRLMNRATPNVYLNGLLAKVIDLVAEGGSLSRAFKRVGHFPLVLIDIIAVGEQTGHLSTAFDKVARRYDKELNQRIQRMTALIQPLVIVVMAILVGLVAYSIITGIFQAVSGLRVHR
ncbi:MAG: type II secretion system F family protein [Verrucomicrobia bacterium]|nr:type II secretion system F family protein [Verrucomicrobiota bacterium]